jgi:hypothetical protein
MTGTGPTTVSFYNKRFASAVRDAAKHASIRDGVLEQHISERPEVKAEMDRLNSQGLNPTAWLNAASIPWLFRIDENTPSGKLLAEVFRQSELDHRKPRHWRILLDALVEQCFRGPGAPQKWDEGGLVELLVDIRAIQKRFTGTKRNTELAKLLKSKDPFRQKYRKFDRETLRKAIGRALNPKINHAASLPDGADLITYRAEMAAQRYGLPTAVGIDAQLATLEKIQIESMRSFFFESHKHEEKELVEAQWQKLLPAFLKLAKSEAQRIREV